MVNIVVDGVLVDTVVALAILAFVPGEFVSVVVVFFFFFFFFVFFFFFFFFFFVLCSLFFVLCCFFFVAVAVAVAVVVAAAVVVIPDYGNQFILHANEWKRFIYWIGIQLKIH